MVRLQLWQNQEGTKILYWPGFQNSEALLAVKKSDWLLLKWNRHKAYPITFQVFVLMTGPHLSKHFLLALPQIDM